MSVGQGPTISASDRAPHRGGGAASPARRPKASNAWGDMSWKLINHLSLNYLSLVDDDEGGSEGSLREMLRPLQRPHRSGHPAADRRHPLGQERPIVRAFRAGPVTFGRGSRDHPHLRRSGLRRNQVYLLGSVLEQFFARYVSLNSFTEMVLKTCNAGGDAMAGQDRAPFDHLKWFAELERDPSAFDFHVVLRRIELLLRDRPAWAPRCVPRTSRSGWDKTRRRPSVHAPSPLFVIEEWKAAAARHRLHRDVRPNGALPCI